MSNEWIWIGLIALAGFLLGGVYATWKAAKMFAVVLGVAAILAIAGAIAWMM
ncbi:hypothetical protein GCM10012275_05640 [Longimycelium tulufanense]|uniref:Uncharacterized protein n=1 Tax=Longimycelium tulufanense TaxID=907463 RepID=A0A8J3CC20_9PSEU|nr:hypothetical protein [Longimycelium tulufanense]GGM37492.1 hypothetical protein GCM10012275_05640 [Longimycelium tulufanense]